MKARLVDVTKGPRARLGESPRWDGTAWWWVDAADGAVWTRGPGKPAVAAWRTGERTSLVHPEMAGRVVVARQDRLYVLDRGSDGSWTPVALWCDLGLESGWKLNDGIADSVGRLWIGSVAADSKPLGGALLRIERDGTAVQAANGFTMTNGMAWNADGDRLFHVDSYDRVVWAHWVDVASGDVLASEPFIDFLDGDGMPDGLAADVDGGVWVAMYGAAQVRRYDGKGQLDTVVDVVPPQCTSVELGGADGQDLLITTAREGYDDDRSVREPYAGRLFHARSDHIGLAKPKVVVEGRGEG